MAGLRNVNLSALKNGVPRVPRVPKQQCDLTTVTYRKGTRDTEQKNTCPNMSRKQVTESGGTPGTPDTSERVPKTPIVNQMELENKATAGHPGHPGHQKKENFEKFRGAWLDDQGRLMISGLPPGGLSRLELLICLGASVEEIENHIHPIGTPGQWQQWVVNQ